MKSKRLLFLVLLLLAIVPQRLLQAQDSQAGDVRTADDTFKPSESVTADSAVAFPTDI
ncbi:MAG: hypothetical protein ACPGU7_05885 [Gammaproteobacteria bacterium]